MSSENVSRVAEEFELSSGESNLGLPWLVLYFLIFLPSCSTKIDMRTLFYPCSCLSSDNNYFKTTHANMTITYFQWWSHVNEIHSETRLLNQHSRSGYESESDADEFILWNRNDHFREAPCSSAVIHCWVFHNKSMKSRTSTSSTALERLSNSIFVTIEWHICCN